VSLKIQTLKLAQQLADYLTANKKLSIQGIGNFLLDTSYNPDPDNKSKTDVVGTITFESNTAAKTDDGLIEFISKQTGKMKTLAASDLESQLEIVHQFLNIGKAYAFDGIGTVSKSQDGSYTFTQGIALPERIAERNMSMESGSSADMPDFKSVFLKAPKQINWRKPLIALFILLGLGLVILGGYYLYKRTSEKETIPETEKTEPLKQEETVPAIDSSSIKKDSTGIVSQPVAQTTTSNYKFIVDEFAKLRALKRFGQLKANGWPIQMETKDSLSFKLYVVMPVSTTDTARALDSITALNGRKVFIEHNN
jgi:hypothetical protein